MKNMTPAVLALALAVAGCGKLSKSAAHDLIQKAYYDGDDNMYCAWWPEDRHKNEPGAPDSKILSFVSQPSAEACVIELAEVGVLAEKEKPKVMNFMGGKTMYSYLLASPAHYAENGDLRFPCGKKQLGDVVSVSTEGKKATVKYNRTISRDVAMLGKLKDCTVKETPTPGETTETMHFSQDDDGKWAPGS